MLILGALRAPNALEQTLALNLGNKPLRGSFWKISYCAAHFLGIRGIASNVLCPFIIKQIPQTTEKCAKVGKSVSKRAFSIKNKSFPPHNDRQIPKSRASRLIFLQVQCSFAWGELTCLQVSKKVLRTFSKTSQQKSVPKLRKVCQKEHFLSKTKVSHLITTA